jgi:hypothetical protein
VTPNNSGGVESFGPPVGLCMFAHWIKLNDIMNARPKKIRFGNKAVLRRFNELLSFLDS